ncbi:hypothetical protein BH20ACI3_BH20ACI3_23930 [soil metagenome]
MMAAALVKLGLLVTIASINLGAIQRTGATESVGEAQQKAKELWEQAIEAKGGRERLYQVSSLAVSYRKEWRWFFKKYRQHFEFLYVFPNKAWRWLDDVPPLGLVADMFNLEQNIGWAVHDGPNPRPSSFKNDRIAELKGYVDLPQFLYLMETRWVKPIPIEVTKDRIGLKRVDVVHTRVEGQRVRFLLDSKTHLPLRVAVLSQITEGRQILLHSFSDYVQIGGIQMPSKQDGAALDFQLNPDYDENIFKRAPSLAAGPKAWQRSAAKSATQ